MKPWQAALLYVGAIVVLALVWHFGWLALTGQPLPFGLK